MNESLSLALSAAQAEAVASDAENVCVLAGPGSGKSHTLIARYDAYCRASKTPVLNSDAFLITFTNAGADVMRERIAKAGLPAPRFVGTLHSLMLKLLRVKRPNLTILDEAHADELMAATLEEIRSKVKPRALLAAIHADRTTQAETVAVMHYRAKLRAYGAEDYDTLLIAGLELLTDHPVFVDLLMVDEYQDSGKWDHLIYGKIYSRFCFVVGDPDQAVYNFRGGRVENMLEFSAAAGTHNVRLEENFRSGPEICDAASRLISKSRNRIEKRTVSVKPAGSSAVRVNVAESEAEELASVLSWTRAWMETGTVAVLTRYNADRVKAADALRGAGIPVSEPERVERPADWNKALAMLALAANPASELAIRRYLTLTKGKETANAFLLKALETRKPAVLELPDSLLNAMEECRLSHAAKTEVWALLSRGGSILESWKADAAGMLLYAMETGKSAKRATAGVEVLTIHGSKGREFDAVILPGWDEGLTSSFPGKDSDEDRRLAFVAVTRARREVLILSSRKRANAYAKSGPIEDRKPSRFIQDMMPEA